MFVVIKKFWSCNSGSVNELNVFVVVPNWQVSPLPCVVTIAVHGILMWGRNSYRGAVSLPGTLFCCVNSAGGRPQHGLAGKPRKR